MYNSQFPAPGSEPTSPNEVRTHRVSDLVQPRPTPELGRRPRFVFTDFAMI